MLPLVSLARQQQQRQRSVDEDNAGDVVHRHGDTSILNEMEEQSAVLVALSSSSSTRRLSIAVTTTPSSGSETRGNSDGEQYDEERMLRIHDPHGCDEDVEDAIETNRHRMDKDTATTTQVEDNDGDPTTTLNGDAPLLEVPSSSSSFRRTCRFVTHFGIAAYKYGSPSFRVASFVQSLMTQQQYTMTGMFGLTNTECIAAFSEHDDTDDSDSDQIITIRTLPPQQFHLYRLGRISDIAKQVLRGDLTQSQALQALQTVEEEPDPFGWCALFLSYIAIGAGLAALFHGSWADCIAALVCSSPVFLLTAWVPSTFAKASLFLSAGVSAALATTAQQYSTPTNDNSMHAGVIVLSSIAVLLPGYAATLAVSELLSHHIVCGVDRLVHAMVDLLLLFAGAWSGSSLLGRGALLGTFPVVVGVDDDDASSSTSPYDWLGVITPILLIALGVQFQTSLRDFPWVLLHVSMAFCTVFFLGRSDNNQQSWGGVFVAALLTTASAQCWARWQDRPRSIVLVPCMVLLVSGSIGFRGLVTLAATTTQEDDENTESSPSVSDGIQQVLEMFLITFLILGGVTVGSVLVPTKTTL